MRKPPLFSFKNPLLLIQWKMGIHQVERVVSMSWFSKLFKWMIGDDKKELEMIEDPVKEKKEYNQEIKGSSRQEVTAKVTYTYPKGNFRFPVIPDEEIYSSEQKQKIIPIRHDERKQKTIEQVQQIVPDASVNHRSFRPSEIPSPIYGYGPRKDDLYTRLMNSREFQQHARESFYEKEESEIISEVKTFAYQGEEVVVDRNTVDKSPLTLFEDEHTAHHNLAHFESNSEEQKVEEHSLLHFHESVKKENDDHHLIGEVESVPTIETEEILIEQVEEKTDKKQDETIGLDNSLHEASEEETEFLEQISEDVSDNDSESTTSNETAEINRESLVEHQVLETPSEEINEQISAEVQSETNGNETLSESGNKIHSVRTSEEKLSNKEVKVTEAKLKSPNEQKEPRPQSRQSAVPYNVLMFGRDKRNLQKKEEKKGYLYPSLSLLAMPPSETFNNEDWVREQAELLNLTLKNFNVRAKVVNVTQGPSVTRLEVQPEPGVKVSKITNLTDDIKLSLSARDIRMEAPIPGKNTIGIEVPNPKSKMVFLREILRSPQFTQSGSPLTVALGLDISGKPVVTDLKKMPHGLIAGATGSGKSVCINTMLVSLLYKATPQEVKLLLIDPKMVELAPYNHIPHLVSPVITDVKAATQSLKWAVEEMERRYELFAHAGVRDIARYNEQVEKHRQGEKLSYIVIVIDELADLMMVAPGDVEEAICRIAQKARACGIHLLIATQRPSVDVITGLIKANIPTRIAFSVSSQVDSRTIIDTSGAERLLGKGDMLFLENGSSKAVRLQGNFVSDEEIERVVEHARNQGKPHYLFSQQELLKKVDHFTEEDELFNEACEFVIDQGGASTSSLQRRFRIGYNRAARLIDLMEEHGIISESKGSKPRDVLVTEAEFKELKESSMSES